MVQIAVHAHHLSAIIFVPAFLGLWHNAMFMALRGYGTPHATGMGASSGCGLRFVF
jgi:hypothetical protein